MNAWLNKALDRAQSVDDWLSPVRRESLQLLHDTPWPNHKVEAWKYTPVRALEQFDLPQTAANTNFSLSKIDGLESIDLVFIDGKFDVSQSATELPQGLSVTDWQAATEQQRKTIATMFGRVKPARHVFGLWNDVLSTDGVLIQVDDGVVIEQLIRITHFFSDGAEAHTRVLLRIGDSAKVSVAEHYVGDSLSVNTGYGEFALEANAELEYYRFALQGGESVSIGGSHFSLADRAKLHSTIVGFGSSLSRLDVDVDHRGEYAQAVLNAVYLLDADELFDLHTTIEHSAPNGTTKEKVRGIAGGQSRAVFNGRIHIHPHAQQTVAELNNRNLLLTNRAQINTKPELEIYADNVRCAHGATISEIDEKALYYLQSRGSDLAQARIMLNFAFINELVDELPNQVLAQWLRPLLRQRFTDMVA